MKTGNQPYYTNTQIQYSAKTGEETVKVDAKLEKSVLSKLQGARDGRISQADALDIAKDIADGGRYGAGEKGILKALWAARDDRKTVTIGGQRIRITDPGEKAFTHSMLSFWGQLGAKASNDVKSAQQALPAKTQTAIQQFANQQIGN